MDMQEIYHQIAKAHGVTVSEVTTEIQNAINAAWTKPEKLPAEERRQPKIHRQGNIPPPDEVIQHIAGIVNGIQ